MRGEGRRMGVSFRVMKTGTRFQPRPVIARSETLEDASAVKENVDGLRESCFAPRVMGSKPQANIAKKTDESARLLDLDVSFTLNLFPDGFFIGKMNELAVLQEVPKSLHPYSRASETLFSAMETGWLPGDILDDIPSKFVNGCLICEVRDYRKCSSEQGFPLSSIDNSPLIKRIQLRMSLETIVKDIPSISDDSWTYRDLLEVESRILKTVQPNLILDPTPMMDRLCQNPISNKLDLKISDLRKKRLQLTPEVTVTSNGQTHGKIFVDRLPASINPSIPLMNPNVPSHQTIVNSFGKRENEDVRLMHLHSANKRPKQDGVMPPLPQQQVASPLDGVSGTEMQWKNPILMAGGCYMNQPGIRSGVKEEKTEMERRYEPEKPKNSALQLSEKEGNMLDPLQYAQQMLSRAHFASQPQHWHMPESKKADSMQKKKSTQSPRVSTGPTAHSPVSSKSGELSSGSMGSARTAQREKSTLTSGGNAFKRKPNPPLKNQPAVSPASIGNSGAQLATPAATEQAVFDSFSKIESITQRYQLKVKKHSKVENIPPQKLKPPTLQNISFCLSNALTNDDYNDPVGPMSRSLLNGTMNTVKMRVLAFSRQEHFYQGIPVPSTSSMQDSTRVIMRELPTDGTVIMHYGSIDELDLQSSHGCPPLVLPNTQYADLLAAQLCRLMERQSYQLKEDNIQPLLTDMINNLDGFGAAFGLSENVGPTIQQRANLASPAGQAAMGLPGLSQGFQTMTRPMAPGAQPGVQPSFLPGGATSLLLPTARTGQPTAHLDQLAQQQPQPPPPQQQQSQGQTQPVQMQKSTSMVGVNPLSRLMSQSPGMPMVSNPMVGSKSTHLQMQMMQQQHHPQMPPGKPMMGMGSVMGMGAGLRSMPGQMNLGPAAGFGPGLRAAISPVQMTALKLRMAQQSRAAAAAGVYGGAQPSIMGGQMLANSPAGLSMLGQSLNRATMSPLQRATMSSMGPPKIAAPANFYLNQQQQQQLQNHQIMVQQQQQQMGSPMQQVGSPMVVGSPSGMGQQTPVSPQQINNGGATPASPQLSSQTVGSVTSSPMEQLQGSNKAASVVINE